MNVALDSSLSKRRENLKVWLSEVSERIGSSPRSVELEIERVNQSLHGIAGIDLRYERAGAEEDEIVESLVTLPAILLLDESEGN